MGISQKCPECGSVRTKVVMTKPVENDGTLRRRHCTTCDYRWYTYQDPEMMVKAHQVVWRHRHYVRVLRLDETRKASPAG
jgi:transcriptional regulator NrdR family protein